MSYQRFYCKVLESNLLIQNSQHGFRKGRSCSTNLLEFLDKVSGCVDSGDNVDIVFLDFAKAFDKVSYWKLLLKLQAHGIEGKLLDWITQWLKNRVQRVRIRGIESDWLLALSGVPRGRCLARSYFSSLLTTWTLESKAGSWNLLTTLKYLIV